MEGPGMRERRGEIKTESLLLSVSFYFYLVLSYLNGFRLAMRLRSFLNIIPTLASLRVTSLYTCMHVRPNRSVDLEGSTRRDRRRLFQGQD